MITFPRRKVVAVLAALALLLPTTSLVNAQGDVNFQVDWGSSQQAYTYTFSGTVTCQGRPCAGAQVDVDVQSSGGVATQSTTADDRGRYVISVHFAGVSEESTEWKLMARNLLQGNQVEIEGRRILMAGETEVIVERPIQITGGKA